MNSTKLYFKPLTGLRFIAALMVFITHLFPRNYGDFINNLLTEFQVGVPIFFVLSGFLIGYRYFDQVNNVKGGNFNYFINRVIRIFPLYILITLANIWWFELDLRTAFLNLTLLHGFYPAIVFKPLPHTWSLTVECTFYFLVPFIFFLMRKKINILMQTFLFVFIGLILTYFFVEIYPSRIWGNYKFMFVLTFFGRCFEFFLGIQLAMILKNHKYTFSHSPFYTYASILVFILFMVIMALVGGLDSNFGIFLHNAIFPICIVIMIYGLISTKNFISDILSSKIFQLLGNSSYAFFLLHYGFWQQIMVKYMFVDLFFELGATILLSIIVYKLIEEPLIRIAKQRLETKNKNQNTQVS